MSQSDKNNVAYAELVNRCWDDPEYLAKFKADPAAALEEFGIPTVAGANYHIVAPGEMKPSTKEDIYLPFQDKPGLRTLGDDLLDEAAGGTSVNLVMPFSSTIAVETIEGIIESLATA